MVPGYIVDRSLAGYDPTKWFPGEPSLDWLKGIKKSDVRPLFVVTDRCEDCGFLESFAREPSTDA